MRLVFLADEHEISHLLAEDDELKHTDVPLVLPSGAKCMPKASCAYHVSYLFMRH
jgi:hypothetical protein